MIGLDTNILVRLVVNDDAEQVALAGKLIDSLATQGPGYISTTVVVELCWVLSSHYKYSRAQIAEVLTNILATSEFLVEHREAMAQAVAIYQASTAELADCVIGCVARGWGANLLQPSTREPPACQGCSCCVHNPFCDAPTHSPQLVCFPSVSIYVSP